MEKLEEQLNVSKDQLSFENFENRKKNTTYEKWIMQLREKISGQHVTKAWLKCMEILMIPYVSQFLSENYSETFNTFDNCGFPGSFVYAIHHFAINNDLGSIDRDWLLSSYFPQETSAKDKYLYDEYKLLLFFPDNIICGQINTSLGKRY